MDNLPIDRHLETDDAEQELQDFSVEFQRVVDDLPAQRAIKEINQFLDVVDELAGRTDHLDGLTRGAGEAD